jgi:hypothetical protein
VIFRGFLKSAVKLGGNQQRQITSQGVHFGRGVPYHLLLKGNGNEADFLGFCRNWFLIDPLHYLLSRSDFGFEFAEIFVFEKRLPDSASQQVGESAFQCLKKTRRVGESVSRGVAMVSRGGAIQIF